MNAKLWVVACSRCRQARVCKAGQKTTTCGHCGRTLQLALLKKHLETSSPDEAQRAAGLLNARLSGKLEAFVEEALPPPPAPRRGDRAAQMRRLALELTREGPFSEGEFRAALEAAGLDGGRATQHLEALVVQGVLYEPRPGRYAAPP